jgi:hypothetical protein
MDRTGREAQQQVEIAEAELAVLKQELVLHELINTGEPTEAATALLQRLRRAVEQLTVAQGQRAIDKAKIEDAA